MIYLPAISIPELVDVEFAPSPSNGLRVPLLASAPAKWLLTRRNRYRVAVYRGVVTK